MHHPTPMLPLPLQVETTVGFIKVKNKRTINDETVRATTNASRYMDVLRFIESQSFTHGPGL